jgi:hypothetical protein
MLFRAALFYKAGTDFCVTFSKETASIMQKK